MVVERARAGDHEIAVVIDLSLLLWQGTPQDRPFLSSSCIDVQAYLSTCLGSLARSASTRLESKSLQVKGAAMPRYMIRHQASSGSDSGLKSETCSLDFPYRRHASRFPLFRLSASWLDCVIAGPCSLLEDNMSYNMYLN